MATVIKYKGQKLRVAQDAKTNEILFAVCDIENILNITNKTQRKKKVYAMLEINKFKKADFSSKYNSGFLHAMNAEELFCYLSTIDTKESKELTNFIKDFLAEKHKEQPEHKEETTKKPQDKNTNIVTINNVDVIFGNSDNGVFCTSLDIAKVFEKRHDNVLAGIKQILSDLREIGTFKELLNFQKSYRTMEIKGFDKVAGKTKKIPYYKLSRDGFALFAMSFTGKKALQFKIAFIDTFNQLEKAYLNGISKKTDNTDLFLKEYLKQQNILHNEILLKLDSMFKIEPDKNKKIEILESKINIQEEQISKLTKELLLSKNEMIELQRWIIRGRKDKQQTRQHLEF